MKTQHKVSRISTGKRPLLIDEFAKARAYSEGLSNVMVDGLCVMDFTGKIVDVNDALLLMLDLKKEEIIGLPFAQVLSLLTDKTAIETASDNLRRLAKGLPVDTTDMTLIGRKGDSIIVSVSHSIVRDPEDHPETLFAVVRDITERKHVEMALKDSEQRFRELANLLPQCVFEMDMRGNLTYSNRYGLEAYGYTSQDLDKGMNVMRLVTSKDRKRVISNIRKTLAGEKSQGNEYRASRKDGSTFPVLSYTSSIIRGGQVVGIRGIALDITRLKKAEDQILRRNRELNALNRIAETVNCSFGLDDILNNTLSKMLDILHIRHGAIYLLNESAAEQEAVYCVAMSNQGPNKSALISLYDIYVRRAIQSGKSVFIKSLPHPGAARAYRNQMGQEGLKSLVCVPLTAREKTLGVLLAATEDKRIFTSEERGIIDHIGHTVSTAIENAQLREQSSRIEALQQLDDLKSDLLANVSHELRAPLAAIKGFASSLLRKDVGWDNDTQTEFLATIVQESDRLTAMVNRLLHMSALEAGRVPLNLSAIRVSEIVETVKDQLDTLTVAHQMEFVIPPELPSVTVDRETIGEVIVNLVENAVRCSDPGTRISLEAQATSKEMFLSVTDEGIGIADEHLTRIFDRFYRVNRGIREGGIGTGLGLAICREIVSAHNGTLWAESTVGEGSRFVFSLPIVLPDAPLTI